MKLKSKPKTKLGSSKLGSSKLLSARSRENSAWSVILYMARDLGLSNSKIAAVLEKLGITYPESTIRTHASDARGARGVGKVANLTTELKEKIDTAL